MKKTNERELYQIAGCFQFMGKIENIARFGNGHINETYKVICTENGSRKLYILQQLNTNIFTRPDRLMANIMNVTGFLREKIAVRGGNPHREVLNVVPTVLGEDYYQNERQGFWRAYLFIEGAHSYEQVESVEDFYQTGKAFGNFQKLLSAYPADQLYETIPDFHNTENRLRLLSDAVARDTAGRVQSVQAEIDFALERSAFACRFVQMQREGRLPLRVTHNDTKLNNIMIDDITREAVCILDLDTVMPGLAMNDYGDAIRFGANTALEDEKDLDKVSLDLFLFEAFTRGFVEECGADLTAEELGCLHEGARAMTLECGIRFLTDYLNGDTYYKTAYDSHNLIRCRTQFRLVEDIEVKEEQMRGIVKNYQVGAGSKQRFSIT